MGRRRFGTTSKWQIAMSIILTVIVVVPVTIALLHKGFPSAEVQMTSRDVWVTNSSDVMAGRLNAQIQELDGSVSLTSEHVDLHQDGDDVFMHDLGTGQLGRIDPNYTDLRESILTPPGSVSAYGGGVLAILDPADGRLWALDAHASLVFDPTTTPPTTILGERAQVVVTRSGTVLAASPTRGEIMRLPGRGADPVMSTIGQLGEFELTAVGERAVVLDLDADTVRFEGDRQVALPTPGIRIQQPGPESPDVIVAGPTGLLRVPLGGGAPLEFGPAIVGGGREASGIARPVNVAGCVYGAWAAPKSLVLACEHREPELHDIPQQIIGEIVFRVNRDVVALNDLRSGNVWLPQEDMRLVENWKDTVPPEDTEGEDGENEATEESFEDTLAERTEQNHPPELKPDTYGVRAGKGAFFPVLDNDTDPDGDIITITEIKGTVPPTLGELRVIDDGRALQFVAVPEASGELTVSYVGSDGRHGGIAESTLTIQVLPTNSENRPPETNHKATVTVEAGRQTTYNVLGDWHDPDGDPVYLLAASQVGGALVSTTPDGKLTFTAQGAELGNRVVSYTVSDGTSESSGELTVQVQPPDTLKPVGTPDFARGVAGSTMSIEPLVNDLSPSGAALSIVEIAELDGGSGGATLKADQGIVTFTNRHPGTYYVQYTVSSGSRDSIGLIRFDVLDPAAVTDDITAVRDIGYVRPGQPTTIPVLANDLSMSGDVLSVQQVKANDASRIAQLAIELVENTFVRVTSQTPLLEPIEVEYTITDGTREATSTIVLVPVEPVVTHLPPIAMNDTRKVRVGDFATVDVLANDVHPDEAPMKVDSQLTDLQIGDGVAFVTDNRVRFQAPSTPGTYSVTYLVRDDFGEQGGARVTFQVVAADEASNRPPEPTPQTARVFDGASIHVQIPLTGVDPDGDSVTFTNILSSTSLGSIRSKDQASFVYEAFPGASGTDVVRYEVLDGYGQRAEGEIRIGVVPRASDTVPPVAVDDQVHAKPGSIIAVPVLANDSDPNGLTIEIVPEFPGADERLAPEVDGDAVLVTVPEGEHFATLQYSITNGGGGTDVANILVTISNDAPVTAPTASDKVVPLDAFDGAGEFDVNVRDGAHNPSGRVAALDVGLTGTNSGAADVRSDGTVRVRPSDTRQIIAYTLTDPVTKLTATAFIMVPPLITAESKRQSPYLKPDLREQQTNVDTTLTWNVNDLVVAPSGNQVRIIDAQTAWAEKANAPVVVSETHVQYVPEPGFRGPASITFVVSDATSADDANAGIATIRLPITVGDPNFHDVKPTFVTPQLNVEVGTSKTFDLRTATGHPNPDVIGRVTYANLSGGTSEVVGSLNGSVLTITAELATRVGSVVPLTLTYTFGDFVQQGTVNVTVVKSSLPPPKGMPDQHASVKGEVVDLNVLANDYNPYASEGKQLRLLEAVETTASPTGAKISVIGSQVHVEPSASFIGAITIRYKLGDATNDPTRETYEYATLRVRDVPSPPATVTLEAAGPGKLVGKWDLAVSNGEPITSYQLTLTPTGTGHAPITVTLPPSSTYTFSAADGIANGLKYSLQVRAQNAIGWGAFSASSSTVTPIDKPSSPQHVSVKNGLTTPGKTDGALTVGWDAPADTGGGIDTYRIDLISPQDQKGSWSVKGSQTSMTIDGLKVPKLGSTEFQFTVTAINKEGASTSNPVVGTLTYQELPSVTLKAGGLRSDLPPDGKVYAYNISGEDWIGEKTYTVACYAGNPVGVIKEHTIMGFQINMGVDLYCQAPHNEKNLQVYIYGDGKLIAVSNVKNGW